ncbi:LRR receptor-like serine/threonine-protein kinase FLS2 [Hordeum vulgare]|nr:LRR receptor-like serine/threonine-protein kinase FLS2 [Hordeum vulgare]
MMRWLKLLEEERKEVKIRLSSKEKGKISEPHAIGKVLFEKPAHSNAISLSLGRVWCPIKGIDYREVGDNLFMITFKQEPGKRKVLEDGPWMFDKDLVVVEDYDPGKRLEDYEFHDIPIWVHIFSLPLGMINEEAAEEECGCSDGGKEGATKKGEEVTNPHKTVLEPTRSGNPKNLDMEVGVVKEVAGKTGKELEWTGGADGGNNKETTRTEEDNMLVDELQQKEDGSQAKKLEKGNGQEDDSISQG